MGPDFFSVGWDRTGFLFRRMGKNRTWDEAFLMGQEMGAAPFNGTGGGSSLVGWEQTFVGQDVPSWSFGQPSYCSSKNIGVDVWLSWLPNRGL